MDTATVMMVVKRRGNPWDQIQGALESRGWSVYLNEVEQLSAEVLRSRKLMCVLGDCDLSTEEEVSLISSVREINSVVPLITFSSFKSSKWEATGTSDVAVAGLIAAEIINSSDFELLTEVSLLGKSVRPVLYQGRTC